MHSPPGYDTHPSPTMSSTPEWEARRPRSASTQYSSASTTPRDAPKSLSIFFDCRSGQHTPAFTAFRDVVGEQCSQILALAALRGTRMADLHVRLFLILQRVVKECLPPPSTALPDADSDTPASPWLDVAELLKTNARPRSDAATNTRVFSSANPLAFLEEYILAAQRSSGRSDHLVLFCSAFVEIDQMVRALSEFIYGTGSPRIRCVLAGEQATTISTVVSGDRLLTYRCSFDPLLLQSAVQDALSAFLLPGCQSLRRVQLEVGDERVPCRLVLAHRVAALRRYCLADDVPLTHGALSGRYFAGNSMLTCPTERERPNAVAVAAAPSEGSPRVLRLTAVIDASRVDEAMLCGDTWTLLWDDAAPNVAAACTQFRTLLSVFRRDTLVLSGDVHCALSPHHLAMRHHHFVAYACPDNTMRLREIVAVELRSVPLLLPPPVGPASTTNAALQRQLTSTRIELVRRSTAAAFSLNDALRADVCALAKEVTVEDTAEVGIVQRVAAERADS